MTNSEFLIYNCFDSHVHWQATGEFDSRINLNGFSNEDDVSHLNLKTSNTKNGWSIGFGWDQNNWKSKSLPSKNSLDKYFGSKFKIAFSRIDGHALWVNTAVLTECGLIDQNGQSTSKCESEMVVKDNLGIPTGVLLDNAMEMVFELIPQNSEKEVYEYLGLGQKLFNEEGFTHIRDLSCDEIQWEQSLRLESEGKLTLFVDQYFHAQTPEKFKSALALALKAKKVQSDKLQVKGMKVYFDGALGSEGALLSKPYACCPLGKRGFALMEARELEDIISETWSSGLEVAVHAIGDEGAHQVILASKKVWDRGASGILHLEHAELLRPDTIQLMKGRPVFCHMQPCHWHTDKKWVNQKLGDLAKYLFRWKELEDNNIYFDFGSDSPIEKSSLLLNISAIEDAHRDSQIPAISRSISQYHSYQKNLGDRKFLGHETTFSKFRDGLVSEVYFEGKRIR